MITIIDNQYAKLDKRIIPKIEKYLEYETIYFRSTPYGPKKRIKKKAYMIDKRNGRFLRGFIPLISSKLECEVKGDVEVLEKDKSPNCEGLTLLPQQLNLINKAYENQCGILKAPTAYGKTVISSGIISCIKPTKKRKIALFLVGKISLLYQTKEEYQNLLPDYSIGLVGNGKKEVGRNILLATVQSLTKIDYNEWCDYDMVIVDECHNASKLDGQYGKILSRFVGPVKIGLTATFPDQKDRQLKLEGMIGPVIEEITIADGINDGRLLKPKITLIPVPEKDLHNFRNKYQKIELNAIINNKSRNIIIAKECIKRSKKGKTSLIMIRKIEHGENIYKILKNRINCVFLSGKDSIEEREKFKKALLEKNIDCIICSTIFDEGVNIPSLNCVFIAGGGKSEKELLQKVGRGLRTADGKTEIEIIDFIDIGQYISVHFAERCSVYSKNGWI